MKKTLGKSFVDGILQAFALNCLMNFTISKVAQNFSFKTFVIISIITTVILAFVYLLFMIKMTSKKMMLLFSFSSFSCFIVGFALLLIIDLIMPFEKVFVRETNAADGIVMLMIAVIFIVCNVLLKLCVLIKLLIKNARKQKLWDK